MENENKKKYIYDKKIYEEIKSNSKFITIIMVLLVASSFYFQIKINGFEDRIAILEELVEEKNNQNFVYFDQYGVAEQIRQSGIKDIDTCNQYVINKIKDDYKDLNVFTTLATFSYNKEQVVDVSKYIKDCVKNQTQISSPILDANEQ